MKTVAIIQARLQSTRLPAKVLCDIQGKTMLERVVERTQLAQQVDQVVIATSDLAADQLLRDYCQQQGWHCVAGNEQDVLSRYVLAAQTFHADRIVRITSDCPLIDPGMVDSVLQLAAEDKADYACNFYPLRRFPRGLDCEVLTRETLLRLDAEADQPRYREHVTLKVYDEPEAAFKTSSVIGDQDWSALRWTVDTREDMQLVREIFQYMGSGMFTWKDVLQAYTHNPHWRNINHGMMQKVA